MTKRIKILYTIPNFDTAGSGKVVYDLVKHIDKTKFDPHICCMHNKGEFFKQVENLGVPIHIFPFTENYRPLVTLPFRVLRIARFFKRLNLDIIHSWHWSSDFTEPLAAKLVGIPFIYTKKAMSWGNKSWVWRSKLSTKIITINLDMTTEFFENMKEKTVSIPIGLDTKSFQFLEKTYSNSDGFSVNKEDFTIVSIANLVEVKGIEILLEAVKILNNPKVKVFIVGDDNSDYAQNLKNKYSRECIYFTGKRLNIKDYLSMADVFVIPTKNEGRREGQPIAPIEAMLSGRMVIGSNVSGIKDVLKDFPQFLFSANNTKELSLKIKSVINMTIIEKNKSAEKMKGFAQRNYSIEKSINNHEMLYYNLLNKI